MLVLTFGHDFILSLKNESSVSPANNFAVGESERLTFPEFSVNASTADLCPFKGT
ncbi:hypothetical protein UYSO10_5019 [Kosakonia radicincitans]|nr:hypothetical protein UYSO10_5019 [Kosakonia radicincitans]